MKTKSNQPVSDDFELLISRRNSQKHKEGLGPRAKWYFGLLAVAIIGCVGYLWAMMNTSHSEEIAHGLGMTTVANSLKGVLEILALPALTLFVVLIVYSTQRLYQLYKLANNPEILRRHKR